MFLPQHYTHHLEIFNAKTTATEAEAILINKGEEGELATLILHSTLANNKLPSHLQVPSNLITKVLYAITAKASDTLFVNAQHLGLAH